MYKRCKFTRIKVKGNLRKNIIEIGDIYVKPLIHFLLLYALLVHCLHPCIPCLNCVYISVNLLSESFGSIKYFRFG